MHLKSCKSTGNGPYARKGTTTRGREASRPEVSFWPDGSTSPAIMMASTGIWCDNLIPRIALWKQNLNAYALSAAVLSPSKYSPCKAMQFVRKWCHNRKPRRKSFSRTSWTNFITLRWMSGISANLCPFRVSSNFRRSLKSHGLSRVNEVDGQIF
jgi:hypothetical protein